MGTDAMGDSSGSRSQLTATFWLIAIAAVLSAVVALAVMATRAQFERNESAQVMKVLATFLPEGSYDNRPDRDRIFVTAPDLLGSPEPLPAYRARMRGKPVAVVMTVVARQGYVGPIRLLVSLGADGSVMQVRAAEHRETPGLGDRIDADKSDWLARFAGRSLEDPEQERWAVRRDGGEFDQLTGATITSRAVVNAVRDAALYFEAHREELFGQPAQ